MARALSLLMAFDPEGMLTLKQAMPIDLNRELELNPQQLILLLELEHIILILLLDLAPELDWDMKQRDLIQLTFTGSR